MEMKGVLNKGTEIRGSSERDQKYRYTIGISTYIADTPSSGALIACGGYLIGLTVDA